MSALLGCPFCGGEAKSENYVIEAQVRCLSCKARILRRHGALDDNGLHEAIAAWNTRATPAPAVGDGRDGAFTERHGALLQSIKVGEVLTAEQWEAVCAFVREGEEVLDARGDLIRDLQDQIAATTQGERHE